MTSTSTVPFETPYPGARWWKVDFHAHSPASFDFGADEGHRATDPTSYRDWLLAYMRNGVDAAVISDHNTHAGIDKARDELAVMRREQIEGFRELALFSGVELTVDGGYHLLGVFDIDTPSDVVHGLLHVCGYTAERGSSLGTTKLSFSQVAAEIVRRGGLAIPAHSDMPKGLFGHDLRNQDDIERTGDVVAVEVLTSDGVAKARHRGWIPVQGSDAHHLDAAGCPEGMEAKFPGSHFTWIKMEKPDLFGIKLALSDGPQSVIPAKLGDDDPNMYSHSMIERVVVSKGQVEAEYAFGPWMNTIIGGRGVGKSTIIELVRLVMGRYSDLPRELKNDSAWFSPERGSNTTSRFWDQTTKVEVYLSRLGRHYRVLWKGDQPDTSAIEVLDSNEWVPEGGSPRDRFALLINSQKQIYETARDPQSLLKTIDDQPSINYVAWKETFDELCNQYRTQRAELKELQVRISSEDRLRGELSDVMAELEQISRLRDSAEARELDLLMQEQQSSVRREALSARFEQALEAVVDDFSDLLADDVEAEHLWGEEQVRWSSVSQAYESMVSLMRALTASRDAWAAVADQSPRCRRILELEQLLHSSDEASGDVPAGRQEDPVDANLRLIGAKNEREGSLVEIGKAKSKYERLLLEAEKTVHEISRHRSDLTARRSELAETLSGPDLKLRVLAQADANSVEADLRRLAQKPNSFDTVFGEAGLQVVLGHPFQAGRDSRVGELKDLLKELRSTGADATGLAKHTGIVINQKFFSHLMSLDEHSYQTEVELWFPEDRLRVQYRQDGTNKLREIDAGSPGQKTAALLAVVLQLSNDPLLLDQPEDDLDNKLIYDLVVTTLRRIKTERQVIVVTHNANVVVNADAEHVTVLGHGPMPEVEAHGSIQNAQVKQSICLIMEGGESAFEARYKRLMG